MNTYLYRLSFRGPTHFGETGIDLENVSEWVCSDTLFSALMNAMREFDGTEVVSEFLDRSLLNPPFILSSLFLYSGETCFLPRPLHDVHIPEEVKREKGKELKRLRWLTSEAFREWFNPEAFDQDNMKGMTESHEVYKKAFAREIRPRVSLDRVTQNSNIYHAGYVHFGRESGLYGLVAFDDPRTTSMFKDLLIALGETGLGGEKAYGCGTYDLLSFEKVSGVFKELLNGQYPYYTLLSLYHPSNYERDGLEQTFTAYDLKRRRGWISSGRNALPLKRKSAGFFTEGSVSTSPLRGTLVDVTPDALPLTLLSHKVYRNGLAFTAPLRRML
jgi:CRISPR-associated protein Csm4